MSLTHLTKSAAKPKSKTMLVLIESIASGHKVCFIRERVADKVEVVRWDPFVGQEVIYREVKKLFSFRSSK